MILMVFTKLVLSCTEFCRAQTPWVTSPGSNPPYSDGHMKARQLV